LSTLRFTFGPIMERGHLPEHRPSDPVGNLSQMLRKSAPLRILVVEDESLIRWSIVETLVQAGHTVIEAGNGAAALRALTNSPEPVDAIALDYRLPDSNDLTLLATIRRLSPGSAMILMTAFGTPEVTAAALALGVYQVVGKPFELQDLEVLLRQACASA
jgi:DNA-binding NtrC family response regulator